MGVVKGIGLGLYRAPSIVSDHNGKKRWRLMNDSAGSTYLIIASNLYDPRILFARSAQHIVILFIYILSSFLVVRLFPKQSSTNHHHHHHHHGNATTNSNQSGASSNKDLLTVNSNASIELQLRSRRKAAKMLVVVVIVFAVCYFPVHLVSILRSANSRLLVIRQDVESPWSAPKWGALTLV